MNNEVFLSVLSGPGHTGSLTTKLLPHGNAVVNVFNNKGVLLCILFFLHLALIKYFQ